MRREKDIAHAIELGVDAIGLIFYPGSRRFISIKDAKSLFSLIPLFVDVVAVMVNPTVDDVNQIIDELPLQWLQFHGDESPEFCSQFNKPFIKSIAANSEQTINESINFYKGASAILLDTPSPVERGGTGLAFDWTIIPTMLRKPLILAGGLNPKNVREAVLSSKCYAVDVCSGIEESPGIKDHNKMTQFVKALRGSEHE